MQGIKTRPEHSTVWDPVVPTAQRLRQHLPTSRPDQVVNSVAAKHAMNAPPLAAPSKASQSTSPQPTTAPYQPSNSSLTSRYSLVKSAAMTGSYDRDGTSASATLHSPPNGLLNGPCSLLIRKLPLKTTKDTLRSMVVWSKEFIDAEVLPAERSQDAGFSAAVLHFKTPAGAQEAKSMLDGKPNIANDAQMIVEIFYGSPVATRRFPPPSETATTTTATSSSSSAASSVGPTPRQPSRFESSFQSLERLSPPNNTTYTSTELPNPESSTIYQNLFSPQSPIGNHLNDRTRISGKSLINNDSVDDDETGELLKDPVAYAENGSAMTQPRRSTMPQLPISRLASLSLNTNNVGPQASLSSYMSQQGMSSLPPPHMSALSPTSLNAPPLSYQLGSQHYHRHNFPPVNPADQNPPCNTLYVGNLPIDTSEDELKAMFSKQRGYKRLCFRTKQNGPMCFVEFEDVSFATKALHELYGHPLHNSVKGGIRLSFSKNPLGVRSGQQTTAPGPVPSTGLQSMGGLMNNGPGASFTAVNGPPPGLAAPPGLAQSRLPYANSAHPLAGNAPPYQGGGFASVNGWNSPAYGGMTPSGPAAMMGQNGTFPSSYMMGR